MAHATRNHMWSLPSRDNGVRSGRVGRPATLSLTNSRPHEPHQAEGGNLPIALGRRRGYDHGRFLDVAQCRRWHMWRLRGALGALVGAVAHDASCRGRAEFDLSWVGRRWQISPAAIFRSCQPTRRVVSRFRDSQRSSGPAAAIISRKTSARPVVGWPKLQYRLRSAGSALRRTTPILKTKEAAGAFAKLLARTGCETPEELMRRLPTVAMRALRQAGVRPNAVCIVGFRHFLQESTGQLQAVYLSLFTGGSPQWMGLGALRFDIRKSVSKVSS